MSSGKSALPRSVPLVSCRLVRERETCYRRRTITTSQQAYTVVREFIADRDREVVVVLCLDTKRRPVCLHEAHVGTLDRCVLSPREILRVALLSGAASIIVAHNHPSGDPTPSSEDILATRRLREAAKVLDITLLDHLIVGDRTFRIVTGSEEVWN